MNNLIIQNNSNQDIQQNLYFRVGENFYAMPLANVLEVMKLPRLEYPQKLPNNFVGVLQFNNIVVNVLDIRIYLGKKVENYSLSNKLIIVKTEETIFCIIVDEIIDIIDFNINNVEHLPFVSENQIVETSYDINGAKVAIINPFALEKIIKNGYPEQKLDVCSLFPKDEYSLDIFQKRARTLSQRFDNAIAKNVFSDNKFISFLLNDTTYCIDIKYVKEVAKAENIIPIPCSPDYVKGLMTLKGDFITIINLKKFLDFSKTDYTGNSKVLVIDSNGFKMGFLIDNIDDILNIAEEQINKKDINSKNNYIESEIIEDVNVKFILNMERILSDPKMYIGEE